jgi:hypothetical protein
MSRKGTGGWLYILQARDRRNPFNSIYKIGITQTTVSERSRSIRLSGQSHTVVFKTYFFNVRRKERMLHALYRKSNKRMTGSGKTEWFDINFAQVSWLRFWLSIQYAGEFLGAMLVFAVLAFVFLWLFG